MTPVELYTANTANGLRAAIALEEAAIPYHAHVVDLTAGDQRTPAFRELNPARSVPFVLKPRKRREALLIAQSGAILLYAASRARQLLPSREPSRIAAMQWFMQAITDVQPASAALYHSAVAVPYPDPRNMKFFEQRLRGFLGDCDRRLSSAEFLAGSAPSIADLALFPSTWHRRELLEPADDLPHLGRWFATMLQRPASQKALTLLQGPLVVAKSQRN